jgi:DoxX-like family
MREGKVSCITETVLPIYLSLTKKRGEEELMQTDPQTAPVSKRSLWAAHTISGLMVLFLFFDSGIKVMKMAFAVEATARLGYPASLVLPIGIAELVCVVLYVIPSTAILGAILLTGYLGGATATQVRLEDPWFFFPVIIGVLVWGGIFLREDRLRTLVPMRK